MKALNPFDASILAVLAELPDDDDSAQELVERLEEPEAKEIGRVIVASDMDAVDASPEAKSTARALKRRPVAAAAR